MKQNWKKELYDNYSPKDSGYRVGKEFIGSVIIRVEKLLEEQKEDILSKIDEFIIAEMLICHHENTPTSRLTSLAMKVSKLRKSNV